MRKASVNDPGTCMDHHFDETDTLTGKGLNFFCFTPPVSLSCGNLVPCVFKDSGKAAPIPRFTADSFVPGSGNLMLAGKGFQIIIGNHGSS